MTSGNTVVIILILAIMGKEAHCNYAGVRAYDSYAAKGLVWNKMATVCMRRDVVIKYTIKYNSNRGCCPKLLLYSDEQYQRIIFLKALQILRENEIAKKTGRHEIATPLSNPTIIRFANGNISQTSYPGRRRRSAKKFLVEYKFSENDHLTQKSSYNAHTNPVHKRFRIKTKRAKGIEKHYDKFLTGIHGNSINYNEPLKDSFPFFPKNNRWKRDVAKKDTSITYNDVIEKLYFDNTALMKEAEKRVREVRSCNMANRELTQVLDKTQIIQLCPKAGISIDPSARASKICGQTIRPPSKVFLPNLTATQSWYGYSEKTSGNKNFRYYQDNTWHLVLLNCPGSPPLNITYVIEFNVVQNVGKKLTDPNYVDPLLDKVCETTVLPAYSIQDGILYGSSSFKVSYSPISVFALFFTTLFFF
uniref:uncharacterized protein LOC120329361 n=1 Tax=Styela clava TaxID=7725 RepID=UPI0019392BB4|nr:uncharacterized protein LOC120329361 [Styela clava]